MAQSFHLLPQHPSVTSSPIEVRVWIEGLDYSFLAYGEIFERAEINGEKLLNITQQKLKELGIIQTDHQDIILKAVANICKKDKVEEQDMQGEDQNDKKMPTRLRKQTEHLEHAIDRVLVMISERRRARSLHGTNEQPPHNILTAALELINMVKMILNILERPPFDCMSEFSSLKSHLIKLITLLKHFSEQSDLSYEMESDMIDVCKNVNKICDYIIALPPDVIGPETQITEFLTPEEEVSRVQVPVTTTSSSSKHILSLQHVSLPIEIASDKLGYFSLKRLNSPSNERAVMSNDEGSKSETEVSDTKISETSAGSLDDRSLQDLKIIENDTLPLESGSERCMIDSDSDRGIGLDSDLEEHSKDSGSIIWGMDSDSEKCPMDSNSMKYLLEAEKCQMASGSVKDVMESEQLEGIEQCQVDFDPLKYWMDSDSEKYLADSDSEKYALSSDNERPEMDSDSEKCPTVSASVKHLLKAEKCQIALDSVKRLIESEKRSIETKAHWMLSDSKRSVMDPDLDRDGMDSASASGVHLMAEEKHQKEIRSKRYVMDSDSEPCEMDSDSEKYGLASAAVKCVLGAKTFQLSTDTEEHCMDSWSEERTMDLDSESLGAVSDAVKHVLKAEHCQRASDLERFWMGLRFESKRFLTDSERQKSDFDSGRHWDSSGRYQFRSERLQRSSGKHEDGLQKHQFSFERHQIDSNSGKYLAESESKKYQNEFESETQMMEMEKEQCLIFENKKLPMDEERERYLIWPDSEQEHKTVSDNERHDIDSENEAQQLGARKKGNRPQGFWRPIFLSPPIGQGKKTEEQNSVQQIDNRGVSRIQLVRYLSDDKIVRFKEVSPRLSDNQKSQKKLKEKHSHSLSPNPNTFMDNKHHRNTRHKISICKIRCRDYRFSQSFQSSQSQMNSIPLLKAEVYTSEVLTPACHPVSMSPWPAAHPKTQRNITYSLDTGAPICSKCSMEIHNSPFHKCLVNSDDDSDPDSSLHLQIPLDSKYSLSPKSVRHHKTSRNSPLLRSLDPKHPVGIHCPLHQEDSKYSLGSTSYLHCESCSALQNLIGSTVTSTFPMNPQNTMGHHCTPGSNNDINTSNVPGLENEGKFNLTAKLENEANPDSETKLINARNLKDKANAKEKLLLKDEIDHEDETDSEDEKDPEDETDSEDDNNTKDKKDPKDKSDPDDSEPKDSNAGNDAETNNGSDPSGGADPPNGADSNSDGGSNNGTDSNGKPDSNIDNANNNDANSKYSTDSDGEKHTNNSDNTSGLDSGVDQDCTANSNNGTNTNYTSELQNGTGLDYSSDSNNGAGPNNRLGSKINRSGLQNNGPDPQNFRSGPNIPEPINNGSGPNISCPASNNNSLSPNNNVPGLKIDSDSNYNVRPSNAISHNIAVSSNKYADSTCDTKPTIVTDHNYGAVPNCDSDLDCISRFTHAIGSSLLFKSNYNARNSYAVRPSSTVTTVNVTDTSYTTSCSGAISPSYIAGTSCKSGTNYDPRLTHVFVSKFVSNPNYDATNIHNLYNSTNTININNLSEPELEISTSSYIAKIVHGNSPTFAASTNYTSTPENLTTSEFSDPSKLGINSTVFDNHKFGAGLNDFAGSVDSDSLKHITESKDVLDAKESGFIKDFSRVQNPIGTKDPTNLNFYSNSNIPLPSFDIIIEAEPPNVVKFALSSGAVNQFLSSTSRQVAEKP